jgi:hypothetical protein
MLPSENYINLFYSLFSFSCSTFSDWNQVRKNLQEIVDAIVNELLQPEENELIAKTD